MKRRNIAGVTVLSLAIATAGFISGIKLSPKEKILESNSSVSIVDGRADLSKRAFRIVNEQLPKKMDEILGVSSGDSFHFAAVTPAVYGYDVRYAAVERSPLWHDGKRELLLKWIQRRMLEVHDDSVANLHAEQGGGAKR